MTIIAVFWKSLIIHQSYYGNEQYGWWMIYLILLIVIIGFLSPYFSHKCIKCGNTNITYKDVLNYSTHENINEIIDVSKARLHTHNEEDKNFSKDIKAVPLFILILFIVSLMPIIILVGMPIYYLYSKIKEKN
jgi:hypothetical protein